MHFNFHFTTIQVIWTLTFAALLVLLVVLLGRNRARRFPWFTTAMVVMALRMVTNRLLFGRIPQVFASEIFLALADLAAIIALLVAVELARRAFTGLRWQEWTAATLALLSIGGVADLWGLWPFFSVPLVVPFLVVAVAALLLILIARRSFTGTARGEWIAAAFALLAAVLVGMVVGGLWPVRPYLISLGTVIAILLVAVPFARRVFTGAVRGEWTAAALALLLGVAAVAPWGPWPSWRTLFAGSELSALRLMQFFGQKAELLADVLLIQLGVLIALFGRRFNAGWRSHTQQIAIGFSTASVAQLAVRTIWQEIATHTTIHSQAEYAHVMNLRDKIDNASSAVFLAVQLWWIVCLWFDEPGTATGAEAAVEETPGDETKASSLGAPATGSSEELAKLEAAEAIPEASPAEQAEEPTSGRD